MKYYDIRISFGKEDTVNYYFVIELIKMTIKDNPLIQPLIWFVYSSNLINVQFACCIKEGNFNEIILKKLMSIVFSNFYNNVQIEISNSDYNRFFSKIIFKKVDEIFGTYKENIRN